MTCSPRELKQAKPNIIYIIADDAGYGDFGCYGQNIFKTIHIDRLASEGMRFTQHYAGSTVCAPSRSSLMTGQHTGHTFIRGNREVKPEGQYPIPGEVQLLPELLRKAGYVTGGFGKWGLGSPGSEGDPMNQGFDRWFGYNCQRLAHNYYPDYLWSNRDTVFLKENFHGGTGTFSHDLIHSKALSFIRENKDRPFFLFLPYTIPHAELLVPEDSLFGKFKGEFDETPYQGTDEGPNFRKGPYGSQAYPRAAFAAMMERLDLSVGDIVALLAELNLTDNTIVMFTSDNGPHLEGGADPDFFNSNAEYRGYKRDLYEGGIRVPFIVKWPNKVEPNTVSDHISAFWDVLPTLCDISGAPIPEAIDGLSFLPELTGNMNQSLHDYLYWEFHEQGGKQAVRMGNWKGVRLDVKKDRFGPIELYDLQKDPDETNNVSGNFPGIVDQIARIMDNAHSDSDVFEF